MRLVFLYTIDGQAPTGSGLPWDPKAETGNRFALALPTEGYFAMLKGMLEQKIVDEVLVVIESTRSPGSRILADGMTCYVVPEIAHARALLRDGDVIFCRGGFRSWFPFLEEAAREGRWLLLYAANTGRARWSFWDVVFDDIAGRNFVDGGGRVHLDFRKPVNEQIFHYEETPKNYDLCIGASRVHDKKGQWRGVEAALAYRNRFGRDLRCVIPGPWSHGEKTNRILKKIGRHKLDISCVGNLPREDLADLMRRSRVFAHLGSGGQGDRGPIEAMACGCPVIIGFPSYHAPWTCNPEACDVPPDPDDYDAIAAAIHKRLNLAGCSTAAHHREMAGIEEAVLPRMARLFSILRGHPRADRALIREAYGI